MPTLIVDDPATGEEVLADDVNNRRSQIETVVNALDDTNFAADFPAVTSSTHAGLSPDEGRLGLIRLGSTPFQFAQLTCRDHVVSQVTKPDLFVSDWKPLCLQHEAETTLTTDGTLQQMDLDKCNTGFIPHAKAFLDAGFTLGIKAGGFLFSSLVGTGASIQQTKLRFLEVNDGDTAGTQVGSDLNIGTAQQSGGTDISAFFATVNAYNDLLTMTKSHLMVVLYISLDETSGIAGFTAKSWERWSSHYCWYSEFS